MRKFFLASAVLAATSLSLTAPGRAADKAEKIAVTPESGKAVLIIKTDELPVPASLASGFHLVLAPYDAEREALGGSNFGGRKTFKARPSRFYEGYLVLDVKPGTYVVQEFSRQDSWALCYHADSLQFTVKPDQALYLGTFDSIGSVQELEGNALRTGRLTTTGALVHFFDGISAPRFAEASSDDLAQAQAMATRAMPRTTVPVQPVEFRKARFGTGTDLFGTNRVCGGYYKGSAKND